MTEDQVVRLQALLSDIAVAADESRRVSRLRGELIQTQLIQLRTQEALAVLDTAAVPAQWTA